MGTKAVFSFASKNPNCHYTQIIGMTSDGFPYNLISIAHECIEVAKELRCITKFKKNDFKAITKVMDLIVYKNNGWLFRDALENAAFVKYSAIYNPKAGKVKLYENKFDYIVGEFNI